MGLLYLVQERGLKSRSPRRFYYLGPSLERCDTIGGASVAVGFGFLTLAIVTGVLWSHASKGSTGPRTPRVERAHRPSSMVLLAARSDGWAAACRRHTAGSRPSFSPSSDDHLRRASGPSFGRPAVIVVVGLSHKTSTRSGALAFGKDRLPRRSATAPGRRRVRP